MIRKTKRTKTAKAVREKVSALRRQPAETQLRVSVLTNNVHVGSLIRELGELIEDAQRQVAITANAALTTLYWEVGRRVRIEVLEGRRAEYGGKLVAAIGCQLQSRYGRSFGEKSLHHMVRFADAFPDAETVSALRRQLSWSHFKQLIYIPDRLKRDFYAEMCRVEGWSTRVLAKKVGRMLYERTALSKKPEEIIRQELTVLREKGDVSPTLVFQDPYMLDFLQLADTYSEKDLESAILREIERFVLELGSGFAFIERQKRITLDGDDYYIDLLDARGIHVAEYLTELPRREILQERLRRAIDAARHRLALGPNLDSAVSLPASPAKLRPARGSRNG
jgi:predicted nuclease of restriction endonuclease-like (RecB) superfamily